ncbi:MAG: HD domain-containing protein [Candidatus Woesearchaeota archaeon]
MMTLTKKQKEIILEIHNFVKNESIGFAEDDVFENHILGVKNHAVKLAKIYNANLFVVIISAYLHDIYYIQTKNHDIHEIEGAKFSKKLLSKYNLPEEEINLIYECMLNHRGSKKQKRNSIEEKIISCADAMDHISRFPHMFYRKCKTMTYEDAMLWMRDKITRGWNKIELAEAKPFVEKKYAAAKIIFNINN